MPAGFLWRVLYAVIVAVLFYALLPPLLRVIGFPLSADVVTIVRIVVAGALLLYVFFGRAWPSGPPPA